MKGIIFDVDGTLWDSTKEVAVAWNKVLQEEMEGHEILTVEGLQKEFGKPMDAIAESLFPELPEKAEKSGLFFQKTPEIALHFIIKCAILCMLKECKLGVDRKVRSFLWQKHFPIKPEPERRTPWKRSRNSPPVWRNPW